MAEELQSMVDALAGLEFTHCDVAHENILTPSEHFVAHSMQQTYQAECTTTIQLKRPGCTHCQQKQLRLHREDPLNNLILQLINIRQLEDEPLFSAKKEYQEDKNELGRLDGRMRLAKLEVRSENPHLTIAELTHHQLKQVGLATGSGLKA